MKRLLSSVAIIGLFVLGYTLVATGHGNVAKWYTTITSNGSTTTLGVTTVAGTTETITTPGQVITQVETASVTVTAIPSTVTERLPLTVTRNITATVPPMVRTVTIKARTPKLKPTPKKRISAKGVKGVEVGSAKPLKHKPCQASAVCTNKVPFTG